MVKKSTKPGLLLVEICAGICTVRQRAHHEFSQPKNSPIRMNGTTRIFLIGVDYIVGDTFFAGALSEALQPG